MEIMNCNNLLTESNSENLSLPSRHNFFLYSRLIHLLSLPQQYVPLLFFSLLKVLVMPERIWTKFSTTTLGKVWKMMLTMLEGVWTSVFITLEWVCKKVFINLDRVREKVLTTLKRVWKRVLLMLEGVRKVLTTLERLRTDRNMTTLEIISTRVFTTLENLCNANHDAGKV